MFLHVSLILFTRGVCPIACWDTHPPGPEAGTVPRDQGQAPRDQRQAPPGPEAGNPPGPEAGTPPRTRGRHAPGTRGRHPSPGPKAGTPPGPEASTPPGPERGTPPPLEQTPPGPGTPRHQAPPKAETPSNRSACWEIRVTRGLYASYWNAILFSYIMWAFFFHPFSGTTLNELKDTTLQIAEAYDKKCKFVRFHVLSFILYYYVIET